MHLPVHSHRETRVTGVTTAAALGQEKTEHARGEGARARGGLNEWWGGAPPCCEERISTTMNAPSSSSSVVAAAWLRRVVRRRTPGLHEATPA